MTDKYTISSSISDRLRYLRSLINLNREAIARKYKIPEVTLRAWESGKINISDKGIKKCLNLYENEGLIVTEEWIKHGMGEKPKAGKGFERKINIPQDIIQSMSHDEAESIPEDYRLFKSSHPDAIFNFIPDDEMLPVYQKGDFVCGTPISSNFEILNGKDCIAVLKSGEIMVRRFMIGNDKTYHLIATNTFNIPKYPIMSNVKITALAPVQLHRKSN